MLTRRTFVRRSAAFVLGAEASVHLPPSRLRALRAAVRGRVYVPGGHGYDAARVVFNRRYDGVRPPAVVRVRDAADVVAVVGWGGRHDVPPVAPAGGPGYSGKSTRRHARLGGPRGPHPLAPPHRGAPGRARAR